MLVRSVGLALALALCGCDLVYGLSRDEVPVRGTYVQRYVTNGPGFLPEVHEHVYPPALIGMSAMLEDGTEVDVEYRDDGTFELLRRGSEQSYRVVVAVEQSRVGFQAPAAELHVAAFLAGRPDRLPVVASTIEFPYPMQGTATSHAHVTTTGIYSHSNAMEFGPTVRFDWRLSVGTTGSQPGLLEATRFDRAYAIEYTGDTTTIPSMTYTAIRAVSSGAITLTPHGTAMLPPPVLAARNGCVRFRAQSAVEHARLIAAAPRTYIDGTSDWLVYMAPAPLDVALSGALWVASSGSTAADFDGAPTFHDPYVGMTPVAQAGANARFEIAIDGAEPVALSNGSRINAIVPRGDATSCPAETTELAHSIGIPGIIEVAGVPIDHDGAEVVIEDDGPVRIAWSLASDGPVDFYQLAVQELLVVDGRTRSVSRTSEVVFGQQFAILDAAIFEPGRAYIVALSASTGRPNIADGDLATVSFPSEMATVWSFAFRIVE